MDHGSLGALAETASHQTDFWKVCSVSLTGEWKNELGSRMTPKDDGAGHVSGSYHSKVGNVPGSYPLVGLYDAAPAGKSVSVVFGVCWSNDKQNDHAVSGWTGNFGSERRRLRANQRR